MSRVLIATGLFPPEVGGPATLSALLLEGLPRSGFVVEVVPFRRVRFLPRLLRHLCYAFILIPKTLRSDVVLALDPVSVGLPALFVARLFRKRFILRVAGDYAWEQGVQRSGVTDMLDVFLAKHEYPLLVRVLRRVQTFVAAHADFIIAPSRYLKGVVEAWGIPGNRIRVISNAAAPVTALSQTSHAPASLHIVSAGRFVPWKGFQDLIRAFRKLGREDARLTIAGDGPERKALEALVRSLSLEKQVVFPGNLERMELMNLISSAHIFALPSGYEGFSHQLLEAMHLGVPVVASAVGGNPELVADGTSGLLVPYGSVEALETALRRLVDDESLRKRLRAAGTARAREFTEEALLSNFAEALHV